MLALSWEVEILCAAMREAFCIWQGLWAGISIKRILGNNQQAMGLVCCAVSIPVTGRMSKAFPGLLLWKLKETKNHHSTAYSSSIPT
jgi:hypothetical protein